MTNNLKILTILSIFVFILTGYFCFSSTFAKNQIIANNNNEKDNKNSKGISKINNKDEKKIKIENKKNTSWLIYVILLIIIVIVIAVIVIFVVSKKVVNKKNEFKFNEKSKEDFAKENFCPTFFTIHIPKVTEKSKEKGIEIDDTKEDADSFFEILASFLLPEEEISRLDKVEISLSSNENKKLYFGPNEVKYIISLKGILDEINNFALRSEELDDEDDEIDRFIKPLKNNVENVKSKIKESKAKIEEIEKKIRHGFRQLFMRLPLVLSFQNYWKQWNKSRNF